MFRPILHLRTCTPAAVESQQDNKYIMGYDVMFQSNMHSLTDDEIKIINCGRLNEKSPS